jgi:zinc protease
MTRVVVALALVLAGCPPKQPVEATPAADPLAEPLPVDAGVRSGVLDNGLHWYVEVNREPEQRAVLRLAVDAGSILEDDDQLGLAHFVEHMAFNGTANFPGNDMIDYLEGIGTRFGPHLNAHTSFDETVYKLTVPTDDAALLEKGFLVLSDWASGLAFDDEEIGKERGVVLEEWRTRLGPQERIQDKTLPLMFYGSSYPERLPIGTEESLKGFAPDAARRFYADWYRPDLMAVVAVGDFDADQVQAWIEEKFSGIAPAESPRERTRVDVPDHEDTKRVVIPDPEVSRTNVQLIAKRDWPEGATHRDYRDLLLEQVAFAMINERLGEIARQPDAPFLGAGAGRFKLTPTEGAYSMFASVADEGVLAGYESVLTEIARVREHGFRPGELERAKASVLEQYEKMVAEKDKTDSVTHANEIVRVFLTDEPMPGIPYEAELAQRFVPGFTMEELTAWAGQWMAPRSRVVTVVMPEREGLPVPSDADLAAVEDRVAAAEIAAPAAEAEIGDLLAALPEPGGVTETDEQYAERLGFTGWTLSNGVKVWFRETDFKEDEIRMAAFADGGTSGLSDEDYVSASLAAEIAHRSGFGEHDATDLAKWMAGHSVSVSHGLSETGQSVSASTRQADLERTLQLVHAGFVAPRFDEEGVALTRKQHVERLRNRDQDPNTHFYDAYTALVWGDDPRRQPWTVETLEQLELDRAQAAWEARLSDASGWTFAFVGNLPDDFQAQVERYLGSLPTERETVAFTDRGKRPKAGKLEQVVEKGLDPKARVRIEYHGDYPDNTWETRNRLYATSDVLSVLLREELREERGGVYGVSVRADEDYEPWSHYDVSIQFTCDPERVDELVAATEEIVAALRKEGPKPEYVAREQEKNRREHQESLRDNGWWLSAFTGALKRDADPLEITTWDARNDALTPALVQQTAKELLVDANRIKVVLLPAPSVEQVSEQ